MVVVVFPCIEIAIGAVRIDEAGVIGDIPGAFVDTAVRIGVDISYAALELEDGQGKPLTLGVGLSSYSMEERIQRWGIIREAALETIPWILEEGGNRLAQLLRIDHGGELFDYAFIHEFLYPFTYMGAGDVEGTGDLGEGCPTILDQ